MGWPELEDECPNCYHPMKEHVVELGCMHDWLYIDEGGAIATTQGCECSLTLALCFDPPTEKEYPTQWASESSEQATT